MARSVAAFFEELGPGGLSSLSLALLTGALGAGLPVAWRMREVLRWAAVEERRKADAILVLGRELVDDAPTEVFRSRLDHGRELWREGWAPLIVVSGGLTGTATRTEAAVVRDYLLAAGVPEAAIWTEDRSRHTLENLFNARETMYRDGLRRSLLVSDPLHLARVMAFARGLQFDLACSPARSAPPHGGTLSW